MDLSFLDKTSGVTPYLVRLYDSHKLHGLAKDDKPLARAELTSAVTDLLEMELSVRENELVADVLIGLMRQAEIDLREALSERLAIMDDVPLRLILQLANDEISVAAPVLTQSPLLGDMDLIYIIKSKGPEYWQAVAKRQVMSNQVMNILADTHDVDTAIKLAENKNIILTDHVMAVLSDIAQGSEDLAQPLLSRDEVGVDVARGLYRFVGEQLKEYIKERFGINEDALMEAVDEVMLDLVEATEKVGEFAPTDNMVKAADRYKSKGLLTTKLMLGALRRGQVQAFIAQFAKYTGLNPETTLEILSQPNGQGLAIACKAYEICKEDFVSIFLLTNRVRNKGRMVDLGDMSKAINYFNRIKPDVARGIMENSLEETLK